MVVNGNGRYKNTADNQILIDWINRWFHELEIAIENMNEQVQNKYILLIRNLVYIGVDSDKSDFRHRLEQWIERTFIFAVGHLGFVEAYKKIINLNTVPRESFFHEGPIVAKSIDRIKCYSAEEISKIDIPGNIADIIEKSEVTEDIKISIL